MNYKNTATANAIWYALKKRLNLDGSAVVATKKRSSPGGGTSVENEGAPPPAKKKRGRPPKVLKQGAGAGKEAGESNMTSLLLADAGAFLDGEGGVTKGQVDEGGKGVAESDMLAPTTTSAEDDHNDVKTEINGIEENAAVEAELPPPPPPSKKKRGRRPPKAVTLAPSTSDGQPIGDLTVARLEAPRKKKRGRPPKSAKQPVTAADEQQTIAPQPADDQHAQPKKRGRSPKAEDARQIRGPILRVLRPSQRY